LLPALRRVVRSDRHRFAAWARAASASARRLGRQRPSGNECDNAPLVAASFPFH
jgi:hypothetical protein